VIAGSNTPGVFYLTDTSAAGTLINGVRYQRESHAVRPGDLIHLGTDALEAFTSSPVAFVLQNYSFSQSHRPILELEALEAKFAKSSGNLWAATDPVPSLLYHNTQVLSLLPLLVQYMLQ
jgi:hypothetical protein